MGMWLNRKQMEFRDIYGAYAVYSSLPKQKIHDLLSSNLNIGVENLPFIYHGKAYIEEIDDFRKAILDKKFAEQTYIEKFDNIKFMGDSLFKNQLIFSKYIPEGVYNVEIYLIDSNELVGMQSIPMLVKKTGVEAVIHNFAYEESLLYGILCVIAAVFAGWLASIIFWKI